MRILLAIDSLDVAELALNHLPRYPWPRGSTVEVLSVVDPVDLVTTPQLIEDLKERAQELTQYAGKKIEQLGIESLGTVLSGNPKRVIVGHAEETGADFILIGANSEIARKGSHLGSIAKAVLRAAHCSVEFLRTPSAPSDASGPPKVLLPTDGSEYSLAAARSVVSRPWPAGTEVRILSAVEPRVSLLHVPFPAHAEELLRTEAMQHAQAAIREVEEIVTNRGLRATEAISVLLAKPESVITVEADQWKADLIVVGSHGRRGFDRLLLGSVSEGVALHSACSVDVVRPIAARSRITSPLTVEAHEPA